MSSASMLAEEPPDVIAVILLLVTSLTFWAMTPPKAK